MRGNSEVLMRAMQKSIVHLRFLQNGFKLIWFQFGFGFGLFLDTFRICCRLVSNRFPFILLGWMSPIVGWSHGCEMNLPSTCRRLELEPAWWKAAASPLLSRMLQQCWHWDLSWGRDRAGCCEMFFGWLRVVYHDIAPPSTAVSSHHLQLPGPRDIHRLSLHVKLP